MLNFCIFTIKIISADDIVLLLPQESYSERMTTHRIVDTYRHIHPHEDNHGHEVHPHDLGEEEDDDVGALGAGDPDEELGHREQQS